jgi:hypothetical protein
VRARANGMKHKVLNKTVRQIEMIWCLEEDSNNAILTRMLSKKSVNACQTLICNCIVSGVSLFMQLFKKLGVAFVSLLISVLFAEASLRLISRLIPVAVMAAAPKMNSRTQFLGLRGIQVRNRPTIVISSTKGGLDIVLPQTNVFRPVDPEDAAQGAVSTEYRIDGFCNNKPLSDIPAVLVAVGDSFTYCTSVAVADAWPLLLSGRMGIPTMNLGIPGKGLPQYYDAVKAKAPESTKVVIVAIYEGNDLRDSLKFETIRERKRHSVPIAKNHERFSGMVRSSFLGDTYILSFVWGSILLLKDKFMNPEFSYDVMVNGQKIALNVHDTDLDEVHFARQVESGEIGADDIRRTWQESMEWMMELARVRGFSVVWAYIPSAYTAYGPSVKFHDASVGYAVQNFSKLQRQTFARICQQEKLHCVDTVPAFETRSANKLTHFPSNVHLTPFGHKVVADTISQYILNQPSLRTAVAK